MVRRTALLNARLLDPHTGLDERGGLLIENGLVADLDTDRVTVQARVLRVHLSFAIAAGSGGLLPVR